MRLNNQPPGAALRRQSNAARIAARDALLIRNVRVNLPAVFFVVTQPSGHLPGGEMRELFDDLLDRLVRPYPRVEHDVEDSDARTSDDWATATNAGHTLYRSAHCPIPGSIVEMPNAVGSLISQPKISR